jgi:pilus assembly protein CpaD
MSSVCILPARRSSRQAWRVAAIIGCAAMLAGCYTAPTEVVGSVPTDYRNRHPIVIKETPRTVELFIGERRGALTGAQRAEVLSFANEWRRESSGGVIIDLPTGTNNAAAAASALQEVRSILSAAGVPPQSVEVRPHRVSDPRKLATLRLNYPRIAADAGPCGLWPKDLGPTYEREYFENGEYWNLGCASQRNLAAMVDNPADLVQPRGEVPPYSPRRNTVFEKYRKGESTATVYADDNKGKISNVGQ